MKTPTFLHLNDIRFCRVRIKSFIHKNSNPHLLTIDEMAGVRFISNVKISEVGAFKVVGQAMLSWKTPLENRKKKVSQP